MEINLVQLEEKNGYYEYDFFPERKFDGVSHILLYKRESFGNLEYYWHFLECDRKNIQVIIYTSLNLFPITSLCAHKCRMTKTNVSLFYAHDCADSFYHFQHRKAFVDFNVPKWDISNPLREMFCCKSWQLGEATAYCSQRPLHMELRAFEKYQQAREVYKEGTICLETRHGPVDPIGQKLAQFGPHVVGNDYKFQQEVIQKYHGEDCYLSFQILASLYNKCAFVGISGAGSLFTLALPVNTIFVMDNELNVPEANRLYKSQINRQLFNIPTHGFPYYISSYGFGSWDSGWRWAMIEEAFASISSIKLPEVHVNFPTTL